VGGAWLEICAGSRSSKTGGARIETIGALKMVKAKSVSVACGAAYTLNCASESATCGGDRVDKASGAVAITAGGGLSVKASNVNISGETKVVLRVGGTSIEVTPGSVKIKSPSVDVKGAKALKSSVMHKSG
jgi:type VI secretion system secreted protein VgrG